MQFDLSLALLRLLLLLLFLKLPLLLQSLLLFLFLLGLRLDLRDLRLDLRLRLRLYLGLGLSLHLLYDTFRPRLQTKEQRLKKSGGVRAGSVVSAAAQLADVAAAHWLAPRQAVPSAVSA